jgi:two-component system, NarL family, nitrate/nitrite response regulator NarL
MVPATIAIFDENPVLLDALCALCIAKGYDVVATGRSAGEAIKLATIQRIDIFVLDPTMPGGMDAISTVLSQSTNTNVVAYSPAIGADYAVRAIEAGARGYVLKKCGADELIAAIRSVIDGETFITPSFATTILVALRDDRLRKQAAQLVDFSIRENQIMRLLLRGRTNKEIANALAISEKTVKCYMTTVMQKLNARNRTEAVLACQKIGLEQDIELSAH